MMLLIHIAAGVVAVVAGGVALFTAKGRDIHRRSGQVFVAAMLVMGLSGALIAALTGVISSVLGGVMAAYFAVTALTTVRRPPVGARALDVALCLLAFSLAAGGFGAGFAAASAGRSVDHGVPTSIFFVDGVGTLLAGIGDVRMIRGGGLAGSKRITRHIWRMCVALFMATGSFFLGQSDEFPQALRIPALLAIPAFLPLIVMTYWLRRVSRRNVGGATARGRGGAGAPAFDADRPEIQGQRLA